MFEKLWGFIRGVNGGKSRFAGRHILVVEDGEVERKFISRTLEKQGFVVQVAADGEEGLNIAKSGGPLDLIVLDYHMPGYTGKEVCAELKRFDQTRDIPVIFLTGSASSMHVVECYDVGAEYFLRKPISGGHLIRQIEMILGELTAAQQNS